MVNLHPYGEGNRVDTFPEHLFAYFKAQYGRDAQPGALVIGHDKG